MMVGVVFQNTWIYSCNRHLWVTPAEEREVATQASVASSHVLSLIWSVTSASISVLKKMGKMDRMEVTY